MAAAGQQAQCPNCGGPILFRAGMSGALVCPHCSFVVVRTDRDLSLRGKIAQLAPTQALLGLGANGQAGGVAFTVLGRVQLDQGAGPWDEWYVVAGDGSWAWLAHAQGLWLLTRQAPLEPAHAPSWDQIAPGNVTELPGGGVQWTVQERGVARVVSAEGELPFAIEPGAQGMYADLVAPDGRFATIDLGDGAEPPRLFVGSQLPEGSVTWQQGVLPVAQPAAKVGTASCPSCGAPVAVLSPERSERAVCGHCNALLDVERGAFRFVEQLQQQPVAPRIPLGSRGRIRGDEWTVIGFMVRYCVVDHVAYPWREYLLYDEKRGFRFLVEDNGHWTFVRTLSAAEIADHFGSATWRPAGGKARTFRRFSSNVAQVSYVLGEFYWKVSLGETVVATDYIDPPEVLSREEAENEITWSIGSHLDPGELWKGLSLRGSPPAQSGVGSAEPRKPWRLAALVALLGTLGMCLITCIVWDARPKHVYVDGPLALGQGSRPALPGGAPVLDPNDAYFTQPFWIAEETSLSVELKTAGLDNGWAGAGFALVNDTTGDVFEFDLETEHYHGYEGGEYWTEGSTAASERVAHVTPGWYVLRVDPEWSQATGMPTATLRIETANPGVGCGVCLFPLLWLPFFFIIFRSRAHESRRWYNSNP